MSDNREDRKDKLYTTQAISELVDRFNKRKLSQNASKSNNNFTDNDFIEGAIDKLKDIADLNDDNELNAKDIYEAFNKVNGFLEKLTSFLPDNNKILNEEPEEFPEIIGPKFIYNMDDEAGVVAFECPRCKEYEKAFVECKKCETVDKMRENYPAPPSNETIRANNVANEKFDIESQEPVKINKKTRVKRFLKAGLKNTGNKLRPRDKTGDKHIIHHYKFPGIPG